MIVRVLELRSNLEQFMYHMRSKFVDIPGLPSVEQWEMLEAWVPILQCMGGTINDLQGDHSRLGQCVPLFLLLLKLLGEKRSLFAPVEPQRPNLGPARHSKTVVKDDPGGVLAWHLHQGLENAIADHLKKPFSVLVNPDPDTGTLLKILRDNKVEHWWALGEMAAVISMGLMDNEEGQFLKLCRKDTRVGPSEAWTPYILASRMAEIIWALFLQHPDMYDAVDVQSPQPTQDPLPKTGPMPSMLANVPGQSSVAPMAGRPMLGVKDKIRDQVEALLNYGSLPGVKDPVAMCRWWHSGQAAQFSMIKPFARLLLSIPAGNGALERHFGRLQELFNNPQRLLSLGQHVLLSVNGPSLQMEGYEKQIQELEEDPDELLWEIPRVAVDYMDFQYDGVS